MAPILLLATHDSEPVRQAGEFFPKEAKTKAAANLYVRVSLATFRLPLSTAPYYNSPHPVKPTAEQTPESFPTEHTTACLL